MKLLKKSKSYAVVVNEVRIILIGQLDPKLSYLVIGVNYKQV